MTVTVQAQKFVMREGISANRRVVKTYAVPANEINNLAAVSVPS